MFVEQMNCFFVNFDFHVSLTKKFGTTHGRKQVEGLLLDCPAIKKLVEVEGTGLTFH